jgi:group I intron endonuclease
MIGSELLIKNIISESLEDQEIIHQIYYYVYLTTNNITKQQYVGDRSTTVNPENDRYFGSGREIKLALCKYGRRNFSKIVLEKCKSRQEAGNRQKYYIKLYKTHISQGGYNVNWDGGTCCGDRTHSEESKQLMRDKAKYRKPQSEETKIKRNMALMGHEVSDETKEKIKQKQKNISKKNIFIRKHGEIEGNIKYNEFIEKMRFIKLNMSQETKDKIRINTRIAMQKPEVKDKQSKAMKGKIPWNKKIKK